MPSTTLERFNKENGLEVSSWKEAADLVRAGQAAGEQAEQHEQSHFRLREAFENSCKARSQLARDLEAAFLKVGALTMALDRDRQAMEDGHPPLPLDPEVASQQADSDDPEGCS